ncbi:MAG: hypothetical protein LAT81_10495 [Oceanicaulis sp.]|nr:hypothetical protein [Oceanicaulis sp.]
MFWSGHTWAHRGHEILGDKFNVNRIDCAAYKLSVGDHYYITPNGESGNKVAYIEKLSSIEPYDDKSPWLRLSKRQSLVIPAGQFAFLITEEAIQIPDECLGFISLKTGAKFQGLINISGFHVDPGYQGKIIYAVYNAGPNNISVSRRDHIFSLWLSDLRDAKNNDYSFENPGWNKIPSEIVNKVSAPISSIQYYIDRIKNLEKTVQLHQTIATAIVTIVGLIATIATLYFTIFSDGAAS